MKKLLSVILALVMILSLSTVAFAEGTGDTEVEPGESTGTTYANQTTVVLKKVYGVVGNGNTSQESPAETFTFSTVRCDNVTSAGVDPATGKVVTANDAPTISIPSVSYTKGEAGGTNAVKNITISLPTYKAVGVYTYSFTETVGNTAGVTYRNESNRIKLVVTVLEDKEGLIKVAAVHAENSESEDKTDEFPNVYSAGSLDVTKKVTGNMGDKNKEFTVKVRFNAPGGMTVKSDITYVEDGKTNTIPAGTGWTDYKEVEIALKHDETITFTNIPYGVTYTVTENSYTGEGYDAPDYAYTDDAAENKQGDQIINSNKETATITNNKNTDNIDMGVTLDSLPYILLLAVACVGMAVVLTKKRRED